MATTPDALIDQLRDDRDQLRPSVTESCPKVGSSSMRMRGGVASTVATLSRRCSPPESVYGLARASLARSRRSSSASIVGRPPDRLEADLHLVAHGPGEELVLRVLEDAADAAQQARATASGAGPPARAR